MREYQGGVISVWYFPLISKEYCMLPIYLPFTYVARESRKLFI